MAELKLYSPKQIAVACFFGTPVASLAMMAANYKAAGYSGKCKTSYILSLVLLPLMVYILLNLAENNLYRILIFVVSAFMGYISDHLQGLFLNDLLDIGENLTTVWSVIRIIAISDIVIIFTTFLYLLFFDA